MELVSVQRRGLIADLKECSSCRDYERGKRVHRAAIQGGLSSDVYLASALISMYSNCGSMEDARLVFDCVKLPNTVCWNALILGYAENGEGRTSLELFGQMRRAGCAPDSRTLGAALVACAALARGQENSKPAAFLLQRGKKLHALALRFGCDSNIFLQGTLVEMYSKCRNIEEARKVFGGIKQLNVVVWTALILGYVDNGQAKAALHLLPTMVRGGCTPNERTFVAALRACADVQQDQDTMAAGRVLHLLLLQAGFGSNLYVQGTLVDMYSKCGCMPEAHRVFEKMERPGVVAWTALILGYAENGKGEVSLALFSRMKLEGCAPNEFTFSAALKACGLLGALEAGRAIHAELDGHSLKKDVVATCLVDFYARCGSLVEAQKVFDSHGSRNLVTWNALMTAYCHHGDSWSVFSLLERMQTQRLQPDEVTLRCILTVCGNAGLVDLGLDYFQSMLHKYEIKPDVGHYNCVINLLGRAKRLDGAMELLRSMHFTPTLVTWATILGACRKWKCIELARLAFEALACLDDPNSGSYALYSSLYSSESVYWSFTSQMLDGHESV